MVQKLARPQIYEIRFTSDQDMRRGVQYILEKRSASTIIEDGRIYVEEEMWDGLNQLGIEYNSIRRTKPGIYTITFQSGEDLERGMNSILQNNSMKAIIRDGRFYVEGSVLDKLDEQGVNYRWSLIRSNRELGEYFRGPRWNRSLGSYQNHELQMITFRTRRDLNHCIELLWTDFDLMGMPRSPSPDGRSYAVPMEAVDLLRSKGVRFTVSKPLNHKDLTAEELAEMRGDRE